ncbi:MAG: HD domain-containing protein [Dehalococcoidia bacterium]
MPPRSLLAALTAPNGSELLREQAASQQLFDWLPELAEGEGFEQPALHAYTVLEHCLAAVEAFDELMSLEDRGIAFAERTAWFGREGGLAGELDGVPIEALTRLSCLVHDIAKPATATFVEDRLRFPRHGPRGAEILGDRLPSLGFGPAATAFVQANVRYHLRPRELVKPWPPSDKAVGRFLRDLGGRMFPLLMVNICDGMATQGPRYTDMHFDRHCNFLTYVMTRVAMLEEQPGALPLIDGNDLMTELNMESGRLVGAVLTSVLAAQGAGRVTDRHEALAYARTVLQTLDASGS